MSLWGTGQRKQQPREQKAGTQQAGTRSQGRKRGKRELGRLLAGQKFASSKERGLEGGEKGGVESGCPRLAGNFCPRQNDKRAKAPCLLGWLALLC